MAEKLVTYKHPRFGTKMRTTAALRDVITGKEERPGPTVLSQVETRGTYQGANEEPAANASTAEWREYRLDNGYSEDELADLGRDDLRDLDDR